MADTLKNNLKSGVNDAASGAKNLLDRGANVAKAADQAKDAMHTVADKAGEYAHDVRKWAGHAGEKAQKMAEDAYEVASDKVGDFGKDVTNLVRRHPLPAILIGFGVGLLFGRAARVV
jgi:ElaB/YqjD/DUF883 family membrane-anchored ribosome-binding protein